MSVHVDQFDGTLISYDDGESFSIENGALYVHDEFNTPVAVHAAGTWRRAEYTALSEEE